VGGNSGVLEHKSGNISETRKDRVKVIMEPGGPIGKHLGSALSPHAAPHWPHSRNRRGYLLNLGSGEG